MHRSYTKWTQEVVFIYMVMNLRGKTKQGWGGRRRVKGGSAHKHSTYTCDQWKYNEKIWSKEKQDVSNTF